MTWCKALVALLACAPFAGHPQGTEESAESADAVAPAVEAPTLEQIQAWWKARYPDGMEIDGPLQEVHLMNKEVAFIATAVMDNRGRNGMWRAVLVRPAIQEVRELPEPVGYHLEIKDIDGDGISEVISESIGSGGGSTTRVLSVFRLDGFTPVVMHEAIAEDNLGICYPRCEEVVIEWTFGRSRQDDYPALREVVTTSVAPKGAMHLKSRRETRRYVLDGNVFVRADAWSLREDR